MSLVLVIDHKFKSNLKERKAWDKILLYVSISLIIFGTFNVVNTFAENESQNKTDGTNSNTQNLTFEQQIIFALIEKGLSQVGPIVGGAVGLGIKFARKRGLQISAEAEEYTVKLASSFVASQSRWIYEQYRYRKDYWKQEDAKRIEELEKNLNTAKEERRGEDIIDCEKKLANAKRPHSVPYTLGEKARDRAIADLKIELLSDEFTNIARDMLEKNLVSLVERTVTQNNKEITEKSRKIIHDLAPLAIDSLLLPMKSREEAHEKMTEIVNTAIASIRKHFDFEEMFFDENYLEIFVKAELNKRIGKIKST